jgi:uncharacterized protein
MDSMRNRTLGWVSFLFALAFVLMSGEAAAFTPPSPQGAVTDTSGRLSADDDRAIEAHISAYRARTTHELAVLMVGSLGGESIDDVAYTTFNTWGVGKKGADNGVLLVIAPTERKMRIETGKGIGDRLTDLESNRILRERVGPMLKQESFAGAILAGLQGIETALDREGAAPLSTPAPTPPKVPFKAPVAETTPSWWLGFMIPFVLIGFIVVAFVVAMGRKAGPRGRRRRGSRSSGDAYTSTSSSSYSSGSSGGSEWSSGGGGGSDFGGGGGGSDFGGGSSGGGGSSDSY